MLREQLDKKEEQRNLLIHTIAASSSPSPLLRKKLESLDLDVLPHLKDEAKKHAAAEHRARRLEREALDSRLRCLDVVMQARLAQQQCADAYRANKKVTEILSAPDNVRKAKKSAKMTMKIDKRGEELTDMAEETKNAREEIQRFLTTVSRLTHGSYPDEDQVDEEEEDPRAAARIQKVRDQQEAEIMQAKLDNLPPLPITTSTYRGGGNANSNIKRPDIKDTAKKD